MVLLEVVTALFIFTLVAFSLIMALDSAFDAADERNQVDKAIRGLDDQMTLLHAARQQIEDIDLPDDGSGLLYHLTITPEQLKDQKGQPVPNILRATITATWKSNGQPGERDISELIYQP
jgi:type II secretory pathway component PulJ